MRFNIVHNYIFIIIDDINNYIHKRVKIPQRVPLCLAFRYADPRHFVIKRTSTLQTYVELDETVGITIVSSYVRAVKMVLKCLHYNPIAWFLSESSVRYAGRIIHKLMICICHIVYSYM